MTEDASRTVAAPSTVATLLDIALGYRAAQALYVVAELGIADLLAGGPRSSMELATASGAYGPALLRLLRVAARMGIVVEDEQSRFSLTPLGEPLRTDVAGSAHDLVRLFGAPLFFAPWGQLLYSVQTGQPAFDHLHGMGMYTYLAQHPEEAAVFNAGMAATTGLQAVIEAYDFAGARTLVDVGGGTGALMASVLRAHPSLRGVLFDLPGVVAEARERIEREGLIERCRVVGGDFFASVPAGGDLYTLFDVVHNWDDEKASAILANCRRAMAGDGRLLLIERVPPPGNEPSPAAFSDLNGLVLLGGRERTAEEHRAVLAAAGFHLSRILSTPAPWSIVEAIPARGAVS
jgi:SAM-dependent methyltransferase